MYLSAINEIIGYNVVRILVM